MLWYDTCAETPQEALPLGNGRLGALIFGGVAEETIVLNEDTLWSGYPQDRLNYEAAGYLRQVRELLFAGQNRKAQDIIEAHMLGSWSQSYMPMANLRLRFPHEGVQAYVRSLEMETATAEVAYTAGGVRYGRTGFVSAPDGVMALYLKAGEPGGLDADIALDSLLRYETAAEGMDVCLRGRCPDAVEPNYVLDSAEPVVYEEPGRGMTFEVRLRAVPEGGTLRWDNGRLRLRGADACLLLLAAGNSYDTAAYAERNRERLESAAGKGFARLLRAHQEDFSSRFRRVAFSLGEAPLLSTGERVARVQNGEEDTALVAEYFQFGRYLLLSSSREGLPANLQGIWSWDVRPPWSANWTTNINTEMNFWAAEPANLPECHETLFRWLEEQVPSGTRTARVHYGARGYCLHHNVDIWGMTTPADGNAVWALWNMAGVWFCHHLYEHYQYANDRDFLRQTALPLMRGSALFCLDWLVEDGEGHYVTNPSTSPECPFVEDGGAIAGVTCGSALDMTLIRELFDNYLEACRLLEIDDEPCGDIRFKRDRLLPYTLRADGRLCEWSREHEEAEPGHRHLSLLYGLYPGDRFFHDPALLEAAAKAFHRRLEVDSGYVGWSLAWSIAVAARLKETETAAHLVGELLGKVTSVNLFDIYRPGGIRTACQDVHSAMKDEAPSWFQIDANLGATAAIAEMLLQSHNGYIELLPCLPASWPRGSIRGLRARGDVEIDMEWQGGRLTGAMVRTGGRYDASAPLRLRYRDETLHLPCGAREQYRIRYPEQLEGGNPVDQKEPGRGADRQLIAERCLVRQARTY